MSESLHLVLLRDRIETKMENRSRQSQYNILASKLKITAEYTRPSLLLAHATNQIGHVIQGLAARHYHSGGILASNLDGAEPQEVFFNLLSHNDCQTNKRVNSPSISSPRSFPNDASTNWRLLLPRV